MSTKKIEIDLEAAEIINRVFLPVNPKKMRNAHPDVLRAIEAFRAAVEGHGK